MATATRSPAKSSTKSATSARRSSYFALSRAPRYSVLFALPLLIGYEGLAALLAQPGQGEVRNGADVMLREAFILVAGPRGSLIFIAAICLLGIGLVVRDMRKTHEGVQPILFLGMLAESAVLAALFGIIIGVTTAKLLGSLRALSIAPLAQTSWPTRLMLSLGAGLYEELFFRVLLVGGLAAGARTLLGWGRKSAGVFAAVIGALVFSAFHYVGAYGDQFTIQSFTFRALSGLAFSALYLIRGFGITAWTHALYDAFLLLG